MRISHGVVIATAIIALGTIGYLALPADDPLPVDDPLPAPLITEDREAPATHPVLTLEQADKVAGVLNSDNSETVFGLKVKKDRNCTMIERYIADKDGQLSAAYQCIPNTAPEPGPYETYTDETLVDLVYADAAAAAELGRRWSGEEPDKARILMLRAVALDPSDVEPLKWLSWEQFSQTHTEDGLATDIISERYVLLRTAEEIGGQPVYDIRRAHDLLIVGGVSPEKIAELEGRVQAEIGFARDVQVDVLGTATIARTSL